MYDIVALGELLVDFTEAGRSETGARLFEQNPGGAPANVACAAARLGMNCAFIGKVGDDMHGHFLAQALQSENVDVNGIVFDTCAFTTLAFVALDEAGERSFAFSRKPGADTRLKECELNLPVVSSARVLHIGSLSMTDEPARSATLAAVKAARSGGAVISYDPNYRSALWRDESTAIAQIRAVLPFVDVIKLSDNECSLVTGESDPALAAAQLVALGIPLVCVTLGARGALVATRDGQALVPGFTAHVVDTTGAGDSFCAAFIHKLLLSGRAPRDITLSAAKKFALFANAAACIAVSRRGAIPAMPCLNEIAASPFYLT
ncbi:MAG: carbohydrate kinase [Clostridia bacterium]